MKAKAIISAALFMACTIASAQTEKKYYMNVETAPEEVQSYEKLNDKKKQLSILAERYGVDEVSVISGGGTIIASTSPLL